MSESIDDKVRATMAELTNAPRLLVEMATAAALKRCGELDADLARVTAERDAAVELARIKTADGCDAMALVIGSEGTIHRLAEELRVARVDASTTSLQADSYRPNATPSAPRSPG